MSVYVIANLRFTQVEHYRRYQAAFGPVFRRFNARLLAADESPRVIEGEWAVDKVVMIEFPDAAEAERFTSDPEYVAISKDRKAGSDAVVLQVNGLP